MQTAPESISIKKKPFSSEAEMKKVKAEARKLARCQFCHVFSCEFNKNRQTETIVNSSDDEQLTNCERFSRNYKMPNL